MPKWIWQKAFINRNEQLAFLSRFPALITLCFFHYAVADVLRNFIILISALPVFIDGIIRHSCWTAGSGGTCSIFSSGHNGWKNVGKTGKRLKVIISQNHLSDRWMAPPLLHGNKVIEMTSSFPLGMPPHTFQAIIVRQMCTGRTTPKNWVDFHLYAFFLHEIPLRSHRIRVETLLANHLARSSTGIQWLDWNIFLLGSLIKKNLLYSQSDSPCRWISFHSIHDLSLGVQLLTDDLLHFHPPIEFCNDFSGYTTLPFEEPTLPGIVIAKLQIACLCRNVPPLISGAGGT